MKIALIHYHLKTGGVTSVLKRQVAALRQTCELLVLTGDRGDAELPCPVVEIPELGYDRPGASPESPGLTADHIRMALHRRWEGGCDILHIHNPLLAKNRRMLQIIEHLRQSGVNLLLQIHDFAEDGRPEAFFTQAYPRDCHYGALNQRDVDILTAAGLKPSGLHLIPNPVSIPPVDGARPTKAAILYPVRAIRRKNLGEAILLSLVWGGGRRLQVTQPPNSPTDLACYRDWVAWSRDNKLPIEFETGRHQPFGVLIEEAAFIITTSIAEGFGLAYLEPWLAGKRLWGRRIGSICRDFEHHGIRLDFLYDRLDVALAWLDAASFARQWHQAVHAAAGRYGRTVSTECADRAFSRLTDHGRIDFGILSEPFQRQVLDRLVADPSQRNELMQMNPGVGHCTDLPDGVSMVEANRRCILQHYGEERYRSRLLAIYEQVVNHPVKHRIDKRVLVDAFFNLGRFSLLQWGSCGG